MRGFSAQRPLDCRVSEVIGQVRKSSECHSEKYLENPLLSGSDLRAGSPYQTEIFRGGFFKLLTKASELVGNCFAIFGSDEMIFPFAL